MVEAGSFGILRFRGKPYIYREVKGYMIATDALQKEILLKYDAEAVMTDDNFGGFVDENLLYFASDDRILKELDMLEEEENEKID